MVASEIEYSSMALQFYTKCYKDLDTFDVEQDLEVNSFVKCQFKQFEKVNVSYFLMPVSSVQGAQNIFF